MGHFRKRGNTKIRPILLLFNHILLCFSDLPAYILSPKAILIYHLQLVDPIWRLWKSKELPTKEKKPPLLPRNHSSLMLGKKFLLNSIIQLYTCQSSVGKLPKTIVPKRRKTVANTSESMKFMFRATFQKAKIQHGIHKPVLDQKQR